MKKTKYLIMLALIIIFLILLTIIIMVLYSKNDGSEEEKNINLTFESRIEKVEEYASITDEIMGWIQVQGTNIDYPVTRSKYISDPNLKKDLDHTWVGSVMAEDENRRAIFGHNILNVSSKPLIADPRNTRFEQLMSFVDYKFAKNNLYIQYTSNGKDEIYKIFAVGFFDTNEEQGLSYTRNVMEYFIFNARDNSLYNYDIDVNIDDEIISLITCTRFFGVDGKTQFRVDARKLRENEKIEKYIVEKSKNYDIIK